MIGIFHSVYWGISRRKFSRLNRFGLGMFAMLYDLISPRIYKMDISWANVRLSNDVMVGVGVDIRERTQADEFSQEKNHDLPR
jgi:hypothetical protein